MKKLNYLFIVFFLFGMSKTSLAQKTNSVGIGFNVNQIQNDYGIGLDLLTPYFFNEKAAVKIGFNFKWLQHVNNSSATTWTPYQNLQIGMRSRSFIVEDKIFIYGEGGLLFLFPNKNFTDEKSVFGGYGLFGVELKASPKFGFLFEIGGAGTGAKAEKVPAKPIYSNGLLTNGGLRVYF